MSISLTLTDDKVTVSNGTDTVTFDGPDVGRFADALSNPGKPAFQQDRMLFTTSVASSFGLWLLQDGSLSVFLMGKDEVLDPKVASDFAASLLGPTLIAKAVFKVGDEVQALDNLRDMNDNAVIFDYRSYGKVVAVTPDVKSKSVIFSIETENGRKVDLASGTTSASYLKKAAPSQNWTTTQSITVTLIREVEVEARSKEDALVKAKTIRDAGVWQTKGIDGTISLPALGINPSPSNAQPSGEIDKEGWTQDAQGRIRSNDRTKFPSDTDAVRFVTDKAMSGSTRHQAALRKRLGL